MNNPIYLSIALAAATPLAAALVPAKSTITAVTVYGDRAVVTRTATVDLLPGTHDLVFDNLPATLADQSIQASGRGDASATILDITARQVFVETTPNERIRGIEDELRDIQRQVRVLDDRARTVGKQLEYLGRMLDASTTPGPVPAGATAAARPSLDELRQVQAYYGESLDKFAVDQQSLDRQREELAAKQAVLNQQLAQLRGSGGRSQKTVTVRITAAYTGSLQVAVNYTVPNASWIPAYDARLHSASRSVELSYFGVVQQNTGEDWTDVALTLSTARPSLGGAAPQLKPWIVAIQQYEVRGFTTNSAGSGSRLKLDLRDAPAANSAINSAFIDALGITSLDEAASWAPGQTFDHNTSSAWDGQTVFRGPLQSARAAVDFGVTSATFKVAAPATIPADNSTQKVSINSTTFAANLQYHTTPKLREAAYLVANAANASEFPLLAGAMNTFLDDNFVASSSLKTVMPQEKFDFALGSDDGIAIKRRTVNRFAENTGMSNNGRRITYEYVVTVTNNKKTAERITVREPLPVSSHEQVVMKLITPVEREIGTTDRVREISREPNGVLAWQLDLKPSEKREVALKFSVDYPADVAVAGLE